MVVHVYSMPQVVHLTLDNFQSSGANMITSQHATNPLIQLFRNTDQRLDILVKNIDRQPVLVEADQTIRFKVFDKQNRTVLSVDAELENYDKGHLFVQISRSQTGSLQLGNYTWCMLVIDESDNTERLLFTDKWYGPNAPLKVLEGPLPPQREPESISPDDLIEGATSALAGAAQTINTAGVHSVLLDLAEFTGEMTIQATLDSGIPEHESEWTDVSTTEFEDITEVRHIGFTGNYTWVRFVFSSTTGLNSITYRNL